MRRHRSRPRSHMILAGFLLLVLVLAVALWWLQQRPAPGEAVLMRITDGDTVHVRLGNEDMTLRLLWIDTPEKRAGASLASDVRRCAFLGQRVSQRLRLMGQQASAYARSLLHVHDRVTVERHGRDYFKRTLALLHTKDGVLYNKAIIAAGYACIYRKAPYPPELEVVMAQARRERRGLWAQEPTLMACLCG